LFRLLTRCLLLRCPACGQGPLYASLLRMNARCPVCHLPFERESGFYLGAIYFNYGLTALIVTFAYPVLVLGRWLSPNRALAACMAFAVLFPLIFFRHARCLWLTLDELIDPQAKPDRSK
jgi:uncharacterized protein (DUF983 family)